MGYLFLTAALLSGVTKGYCGKRTSGYTKGLRDAVFANTLRMLLCILIGFGLVAAEGSLSQLAVSPLLLGIAALSGISTAVFVVTWLVSVRKSAYMMLNVFLMLGVLVPLLGSSLLYGEDITLTHWLGLGLLFAAVLFLCAYNNTIKAKITLQAFLVLLISGLSSGAADFAQKLFVKTSPDGSASVFNFYTYVFAAAVLVVTYFCLRAEPEQADSAGRRKMLPYILIMAVCLFLNSYFKTLAAAWLPAVILYPVSQGASLILSAGMSAVFFQERLTAKAVIGMVLSFLGLIVLNFSG